MKRLLMKLIFRVLRWLIKRKGEQLYRKDLLTAGWIQEHLGDRTFYVEPHIKGRDKIWIEFEHHYYRIYHGEERIFIDLQSTREWLQSYLFVTDPYGMVTTRKKLTE